MSDIRLINLETGGNQAYIFATNKLRNVVGASELLYRVGTSYVGRALAKATGQEIGEESFTGISDFIDGFKKPIEENDKQAFEVIVATSGKALLLARDEDTAKSFIREWSRIVADEAPGVDAAAVFSKTAVDLGLSLEDASPESYMEVFRETERLMTIQRTAEGMPVGRFPRLPIVAECAYSGLPAVDVKKEHGREVLVSASSLAQRNVVDDTLLMDRLKGLFPGDGASQFQRGLAALEQRDLDWLAVVHADGNGLGQLFINFDKHVKALDGDKATGRNYIDRYRAFSSALDQISRETFRDTVAYLWYQDAPDIIPIVVGGDDLTVVMDGKRSLEFTKRFMIDFCEQTKTNPGTKDILKYAGLEQLGMCAGVSIVKPHFPFSQAYDMAEELMKNAKQVKTKYGPDSIALDFHILYDSISTSIADIRARLKIKEGDAKGRTRVLTAKPYVVQPGDTWNKDKGSGPNEEWEKVHDYDQFERAREAVAKLPSSQAHAVRDALFSELVDTQESEWKFLNSTYAKDGFKGAWERVYDGKEHLKDYKGQLYIHVGPDPDPKKKLGEREYTYFLDALEALKFQKDQDGKDGN